MIPHLRPFDGGAHLVVEGKPMLLIGGQVHNSSASDPEYLATVLDRVAALHGNTVLVPLGWDQVEPDEGRFDVTALDHILQQARARGLKVVLLWFGAFKNAASTYAPGWVRAQPSRFPRVELAPGSVGHPLNRKNTPVLSVFSDELLAADRRAFEAVMGHLATHDQEHTVVLVQVENEVGLLSSPRDFSPAAEQAWQQPVPAEAARLLGLEPGSWHEHSARLADTAALEALDEAFMAWHFARHCQALAAAGRAIKDLPVYVNAWLGPQAGQDRPGQYPSGGPVTRLIELWGAAAPAVDLCAPDIYVDDFPAVMDDYHRPGNPLFVPESAVHPGRPLVAFGHHRALGFSFFGVDDLRADGQVGAVFAALGALHDEIVDAQAHQRIDAVVLRAADDERIVELAGLRIRVRGSRSVLNRILLDAGVPTPPPAPEPEPESLPGTRPARGTNDPLAMFLAREDGSVLVLGMGVDLEFSGPNGPLELDEVVEWRVVDGQLRRGRLLNGDERLEVVPMDRLGVCTIRLLDLARPGAAKG